MRGSQRSKPTLTLFIRRPALREGIFQFGILGNERLLGRYRSSAASSLLHEFGFKCLHTLHGYIVCALDLFERVSRRLEPHLQLSAPRSGLFLN